MRDFRPDLVYSRNVRACALASMARYRTVLELHTLNDLRASYDRLMFVILRRSAALRRVVAISEGLKKDLVDAGAIDPATILVAHDGADPLREEIARPAPLSAGRLQVAYVGHLYPGRGIELMTELARRMDDIDFHVVGGQAADVERLRASLALQRNMHLHGFLPYSRAEAFRAHCDLLIAPYQRDVRTVGATDTSRWMSPLKVFEYMAAGKPIVCSDLPTLREVLQHGHTAWLVPPDDVEAWAQAIRHLARDGPLRQRLGDAARREFTAKHTWQGRAARVLRGIV
jgi:glycosyltransferase involved in cell wall biosynthesis